MVGPGAFRSTLTLICLISCCSCWDVCLALAGVRLVEPLNMERVLTGEQSPMFFGSAMTNFGVELFLKRFLTIGQKPASRRMGVSCRKCTHFAVFFLHFRGVLRSTVLSNENLTTQFTSLSLLLAGGMVR